MPSTNLRRNMSVAISISFNYYDKTYFLRYMASKVEATRRFIESVYGKYTDIHSDELSDMALKESCKESPQTSIERINKEMIFFYHT